MYEIRLCKLNEKHHLIKFLDNSWNTNHIFVLDEKLLNFQHKSKKYYNFVVAYHKFKKEFHGVLGFMSPSHYSDKTILKKSDIWLGVWKVDTNLSQDKSIGLKLIKYLEVEFEPKCISGTGLADDVIPLYRLLGFKTNIINHWYMLNEVKQNFYLAVTSNNSKIKPMTNVVELTGKNIKFSELEKVQFLKVLHGKKNYKYIKQRYENHPYYKYKCLGLFKENNLKGVIIGRVVQVKNASAFRITDFWIIKESRNSIFKFLQNLMIENNFEYIDFLEHGWDKLNLKDNGFLLNSNENYVPHYFEPFVKNKVDVTIAYRTKDEFICTKGDCDLDRPSIKLI